MTASEAKLKTQKVLAKKSVSRVFPLIERAISNGEYSITLGVSFGNSHVHDTGFLTEQEFEILQKDYGYTLEPLYDDSGDYQRPSKKYGYKIFWK